MASTSKSKQKHKKKLLSSSRPTVPSPAKGQSTSTLSSRLTRTLIRSHHTLQKRLHQAEAAGDTTLATALQAQVNDSGGLPAYQRASLQGQAAERGGDSSHVLMGWLKDARPLPPRNSTESLPKLRLLEVGALRPDNACSRSGMFEVERIDLHSQHPAILQQDFMARPIPKGENERASKGFDVVSLSLVVNYVGDAAGRGEMLRRVSAFLREPQSPAGQRDGKNLGKWFPGLFLVLPAPCVLNSRYLDEEKLGAILESLGFSLTERKTGSKLVYYYFVYDCKHRANPAKRFGKSELRKGGARNNFAIVVK